MLNPTYQNDLQTLIYEEYAVMEAKDPTLIGSRVVTKEPGCVGNAYAFWEVTDVMVKASDHDKVVIITKRVA